MKVYTIANDSTNLGYTSTVKALAKIADFTYDEKKQHLKSTKDGKAFDETELENFITKISNSISNGEEVCVLFAGGTGWNSRITTIQKTLKNKFPHTYKNIKFILNTEKINDGDTFNDIENLEVITQEKEEKVKSIIGTGKNIKTHTVDIAACGDADKIQKDAKKFELDNIKIINGLKAILKSTSSLFYLGGRGPGFEGDEIKNTIAFLNFAYTALLNTKKKENLVIFTHGLRSFTDINNKNMFIPIQIMYKYIQSNLQEGQQAYIFSQNLAKDGKRIPVLKQITKNEIKTIKINGNAYNWSLIQAKQNNQNVYATEEQQNFPIEALSAGIKKNKINGIEWELQADIHKDLYEKVLKKDNFKISANSIKNIVKQNNINKINNNIKNIVKQHNLNNINNNIKNITNQKIINKTNNIIKNLANKKPPKSFIDVEIELLGNKNKSDIDVMISA